jgi:hypothetical protein
MRSWVTATTDYPSASTTRSVVLVAYVGKHNLARLWDLGNGCITQVCCLATLVRFLCLVSFFMQSLQPVRTTDNMYQMLFESLL